MARWKIFSNDMHRYEAVDAEGISADPQGNIIFANRVKKDEYEIVAILSHGALARKEEG